MVGNSFFTSQVNFNKIIDFLKNFIKKNKIQNKILKI